jgi:glycosyltransferase 2 family protein
VRSHRVCDDKTMKKYPRTWIWASVGFSIVVISIVLYTTFDENTLVYLRQLDPWFLLLAVLLRIGSLTFWSWRIQVMAHSLGYRVPFSSCWNLVLANLLAGAITPGQAGGEPVRVHELYREKVKVGDATAIVIMERVLDGVVLTIMGLLSVILLGSILRQLSLELIIIMGVGFAFMAMIIVLVFFSAKRPAWTKNHIMRFLHWLERKYNRPSVAKAVTKADGEIDNFFCSMNHFTGKAVRGLIFGSFFTALFWISEFLVASLLLMGLGQPPFVLESFLFQLVIAVIMMIPLTPGSSGIAEISATSLYALIIPSSILGIFVLLWRIVLFYFNILLGLIGGVHIFRREMTGPEEEDDEDLPSSAVCSPGFESPEKDPALHESDREHVK